MESKYSYKNIFKVAYPILISLVMEQMIGMTDTAFLGRVGEVELGASAIAGIFYTVVFMIGLGFSIGAQIIIGRRNGEGEYSETGKVFWHGLYFLSALAFAMVLLTELAAPFLMSKMVSSEYIGKAATDYVSWRIPGLFFAFVTAMFRAFYVGTANTKTLTLNSVIMVLSNIVLNYILIFGKLGMPALGITGAAIGSSLSEFISLLFFVIYTRRKCDIFKYGLDRPSPFEKEELVSIMKVSGWTMIQHFVSLSTWLIFFLFVEHLGEHELAISNIVRNVSGLIWMVLMAFSSTGSTLVSNMIGEGHPESVLSLLKRLLKLTYAVVMLVIALICLFPNAVIGIYTDIPGLVESSITPMFVMCSAYLLGVPANILFQAVSGTGNTRKAFVLELVALACYLVYCTVIIGVLKLNVTICWTAEYIYSLFMVLLSGKYMLTGKWKGKSI